MNYVRSELFGEAMPGSTSRTWVSGRTWPRDNGKVKRFDQRLAEEWAYPPASTGQPPNPSGSKSRTRLLQSANVSHRARRPTADQPAVNNSDGNYT
jgi:hypothetical protein